MASTWLAPVPQRGNTKFIYGSIFTSMDGKCLIQSTLLTTHSEMNPSWVNMTDFVTNACGIKSEIANSLTERGVAGLGGSDWTAAKVRMILLNEIYTGALFVRGDPALRGQGVVPAIVSRQDFDKA